MTKKSEISQNYEYVQIFTFSQTFTIKVSYNNDVSLQNALSLVSNFTLNVLTRFLHSTLRLLGRSRRRFNACLYKQLLYTVVACCHN